MLSINPANKFSFKASLVIDKNLRDSNIYKSSEFAYDEQYITDTFKKETKNFPNNELVILKDTGGYAEFLLKKDKTIIDIKSFPFFKYPQYQQLEGLLKVFHHMRLDGEYKQEQAKIKEKYAKEMSEIEEKYRLRLSLFDI